jgi:hypothetical protein
MMDTPKDRYQRDNHFRALVDMMVDNIHQCNYTPSEMRDAAILASIIHEETAIRKIVVPDIPKAVEECLGALRKWEGEWLNATNKELE